MRALGGVFSALALSFVGGLRPRERSLPSLATRLRGGESFWGPGDDDADAAHEESLPDHAPEDDDDDDDDEARAAKAAQRWTRRAFEAAHEGRSGAAASAFKRALRLTPGDAPYRAALLINAGSYLAFSGRSDDALPPLREAASLAPDEPRALHALGNALHQCDAPHDALEAYARPRRDLAMIDPVLGRSASEPRRRRDPSPRGTRGVAATRLHGMSTWHARRRREPALYYPQGGSGARDRGAFRPHEAFPRRAPRCTRAWRRAGTRGRRTSRGIGTRRGFLCS